MFWGWVEYWPFGTRLALQPKLHAKKQGWLTDNFHY